MQPNFPNLAILSLKDLVFHERHDEQRARPLMIRLRASRVLRNPPIVSPLQDGSLRYMVLDGANRVTALQEMGLAHILVQVVEPDDSGLELQNWNHIVWELNPCRFLTGIRHLPGVRLTPTGSQEVEPDLQDPCRLAVVKSCRERGYTVCTPAKDLERRVELLNAIVDSYRLRARLDRTSSNGAPALAEIYPQLSGLVIFPKFHVLEVMQLAGRGYLLPTGITRFVISPRALHVNYPLEELEAPMPLGEKNERLRKWLQEKIEKKGVRYYAEATFLFDE